MFRNLPANGQLNVSIDAHVDNYWTVFDRKCLIYLAEIVWSTNSKTLGAKADRQFFEIWLNNFRVFRGQTLVSHGEGTGLPRARSKTANVETERAHFCFEVERD